MSLQTKATAEFLQTYNWDYFMTVTPKRPRTDPLAFMRDVWDDIKPPSDLIRRLTSCGDDGMATRAFLAAEPFFLGHNLHVHGIIAGNSDIRLPWWFQQGLDGHLGRSRVELCNSQAQVASYCSKYVSKFLGGDNYDYFGDW